MLELEPSTVFKKQHHAGIFETIDQLKEEIKTYPTLPDIAVEKNLLAFITQYTYNSNAIEGSTLTLSDTHIVIVEGLTIDQKPMSDHLDAINHKEAIYYILELSKEDRKLSETDIKNIHSLVMANNPKIKGIYRNHDVLISGTEYMPPSFIHLTDEMDKLIENYLSDKKHPIEKIAELHVLFERVHPFSDGNGRTGRLLMNLELIKVGYQPVDIKFKDRANYIQALQDYDNTQKATKFIDMVARYQLEELTNIRNMLKTRAKHIGGYSG